MKFEKVILAAVLAALLLPAMAKGQLFNRAPQCAKNGKQYGVVEGNFREEWYSYQERGESYLEGECYEAALSDFEQAIDLREKTDRAAEAPGCDKRRARTYGMHFEDWFGHRGKGVVLFKMGRLDEAIQELEFSLECTESSQAQFFLDQAKTQKLRTDGGDSRAPAITEVHLVASEPRIDYVRAGAPAPAAGNDRFVSQPYYFTLDDIEMMKETLTNEQKRDKEFMKSLEPGWGHQVISWKSADELAGDYVREGRLYLVVVSEDDQGVQFVEAGGIKNPYTFAQKTRADVFPVQIAAPAPAEGDPGEMDPANALPQDLFAIPMDEESGKLSLNIVVTDLLGKAASRTLTVNIDREGPRVSIEEAALTPAGDRVKIRGYIDDDSGIKSFKFGGMEPVRQGDRFEVSAPLDAAKRVRFEATDLVGNATSGALSFDEVKKGTFIEPTTRFARFMNGVYTVAARDFIDAQTWYVPASGLHFDAWSDDPARASSGIYDFSGYVAQSEVEWKETQGPAAPPSIQLKTNVKAVYSNQVYIEGTAIGQGALLKSVTVNNKSVLKSARSNAFFNKLLYLRPGKNRIVIKAVDEKGQVGEATLDITRIVPKVNSVSERLSVSTLPFYIDPSYQEIAPVANDNMATSLVKQRRFQYVNRSQVDNAVRELRLSGAGLVDPGTAVRAGKMTNAEAVIIGVVRETPTSIEVKVQVVDVESSRVMITRDAFHEDKSLSNLQFLTDGLAVKVKNSFPIVQGDVASTSGGGAVISLGSRNRLMPGMLVVFYKIIPKTDANGNPVGADTQKIGEGKIMGVSSNTSVVQVTQAQGAVGARDLVVTK